MLLGTFVVLEIWLGQLLGHEVGAITSLERSFTPSRNITCAQCQSESRAAYKTTSHAEWRMANLRCLNYPEQFYKPCVETETFKPRGCGKLVTRSYLYFGVHDDREITIVRRFCASEGASKDEVRCDTTLSQGRVTERCICGSDRCNGAASLSFLPSSAFLLAAAWLMSM
uniref:Protein quiver n=1 Tax=Schistocephalus solidus TaxID=70667 RepID=A0A0X3NUI8_SCHSO